ncbi:MAG: cytochrome c-type biogenesis protein CcmH [Burkholderiaceae bacterium]|tara:strand:+ start:99 stop:491 length:393 start_codon:yes stop_codon:yes gene_type:complete
MDKLQNFIKYAQVSLNSETIQNKNFSIIDEERYHKLTNELRCLVCQNQTIADSNAGLAVDLRNQVADQISSGKTDDEILTYMEERYGEFVLYNPQMSLENLGLWIGPFIVIILAIFIAINTIKKHSNIKS